MKKLKILYIDIEGGFGGSSRSLLNMILGLNKDIFEPVVICKKNGPTHKKLNSLGVKAIIDKNIFSIIPLKKNNFKNWLVHGYKIFFIKSVLEKIKMIKPDILHLNYEGLVPLHYFLIKKKIKVKTILHFRSSVAKANLVYKIYAKHINKHIDHMIFITENQYEEAKKSGVLVNKIPNSIMYNSSNIMQKNIKKFKKRGKDNKINITYIGNIDFSRGAQRLINLAKEIKKLDLPIKLNLYGETANIKKYFFFKKKLTNHINNEIEKFSIQNVIKIHKFTSHPEKKLLESDLLIHPSKNNDPWGRDIIEAMSLGVPVITHGSYDKFVKNNVTGILLNEWNLLNYVKKIEFLLLNRKVLHSMSEKSLAFARKNFSKKHYASKLQKIYIKLYKKN